MKLIQGVGVVVLALVVLLVTQAAQAVIEICPGTVTDIQIEWPVAQDADYYQVEVAENGGAWMPFAETTGTSVIYSIRPGMTSLSSRVIAASDCGDIADPVEATESLVTKPRPFPVAYVRFVIPPQP